MHGERLGLQVVCTLEYRGSLGHVISYGVSEVWPGTSVHAAQGEVHLHTVGVVPTPSGARPWLWWGQHHVRGPREARLWDVRQNLVQGLWDAVHDVRVVAQAPTYNLYQPGIQAGVQAVLAQVDVLSIREVAVELAVEHVLDYRPHGLANMPWARCARVVQVLPGAVYVHRVHTVRILDQRLLLDGAAQGVRNALYRGRGFSVVTQGTGQHRAHTQDCQGVHWNLA